MKSNINANVKNTVQKESMQALGVFQHRIMHMLASINRPSRSVEMNEMGEGRHDF